MADGTVGQRPERTVRGPMIKLHHVTAERIYPVWVNAFSVVRVSSDRRGETHVYFQGALGEGIHTNEPVEEVLALIESATAERRKSPPSAEEIEAYVTAGKRMVDAWMRTCGGAGRSSGGMPS